MSDILSKPTVRVNNEAIPVVPNSVSYTEGEGETDVFTASLGGGAVEVVTSDNAENKLSDCKFSMYSDPDNVKLARGWKKNPGRNVVEIMGTNSEGKKIKRVLNYGSISNNYEVNLTSEGKLDLEWKTASAI